MGIFPADSKIQDMEKYRNKSNAVGGGQQTAETVGNGKNTRFVVPEGRT